MEAELIQGSVEWHLARCGKVTASRVADVVARTKTGWGASRANYMAELIAERMTGIPADSYTNAAMKWGTETEPQARSAYEFFRDAEVRQVGFVDHPSLTLTGASPDGLVGEEGLVEFKCPNTATHIDSLLSGSVSGPHHTQMQWQLACTARRWCDFASFDPRMPANLQLFVKRIERDDARIAELEQLVGEFLRETAEKVMRLGAIA